MKNPCAEGPDGRRFWAIALFLCALAPELVWADGLAPLTDRVGDPVEGQALLRDMGRASCLICHQISGLDEKDQGEIGPSLDDVATRLSAAELRLRIADARRLNPDTMMPPYFSLDGLVDVAEVYRGQTIYSAQDVENVVAYLLNLTGEGDQ